MIIEQDIQLDYSDVLLKPKRTTLNSRSEANIYRDYKMKWTGDIITGNGLTVANMATTGTVEMAKVFQKHKMFTCLHKHYSFEELQNFLQENRETAKTFDGKNCGNEYIFVSTGIKEGDYEKICRVLDLGLISNLCIDIANGYIPNLISFVKNIRNKYPLLRIMVGNVVTGDMTQDLILNGADIVKVGIGPGCFSPNMLVKTDTGLIKIKDINVGDKVLTHKNQYQKVTNKFKYNEYNNLIKINEIESTPHHQYYVLNKKYKDIVTDDNIEQYAEWISADKLSTEYFLIKSNK